MTHLGQELIPSSDKRESKRLLSTVMLGVGDASELDEVAMKERTDQDQESNKQSKRERELKEDDRKKELSWGVVGLLFEYIMSLIQLVGDREGIFT